MATKAKARKPAMTATAKQDAVNSIALAISSIESCTEHALRVLGRFPDALFEFRKANDIHIMMTSDVDQYIGQAASALGSARASLATAHRVLSDVLAQYKLPKPGYGGGVTPLGNGGGKN